MSPYLNKQGYVLIIVLVFLQILSCVGLYELTSLSAMIKTNNHRLLHLSNRILAEEKLADIEYQLINSNLPCLISAMPTEELAFNSLDWWQNHACYQYIHHQHYYYVIENLTTKAIQQDGLLHCKKRSSQ